MRSTLLLQYVTWHFYHAPRQLIFAWGNFLWFVFHYFSVPQLLQTYFTPWRRITWGYGRGFDIGRYLYVFSSNVISRILGAFMRTFLIAAGLIGELIVLAAGICVLFIWLLLPVFIALALIYGFILLF